MTRSELSFIAKLDSTLTKCLCALTGWLISASIRVLGLLALVDIALRIFAYGEGWADVSWAESGFMVIFALLLWRYFRYCRYFATGVWRGMSRLLAFQGTLVCAGLVIVGFATSVEQQLGASVDLPGTTVDPVTELGALGFTLLALYLAVPASPLKNLRRPSGPYVEPEFKTVEKDVTV